MLETSKCLYVFSYLFIDQGESIFVVAFVDFLKHDRLNQIRHMMLAKLSLLLLKLVLVCLNDPFPGLRVPIHLFLGLFLNLFEYELNSIHRLHTLLCLLEEALIEQ